MTTKRTVTAVERLVKRWKNKVDRWKPQSPTSYPAFNAIDVVDRLQAAIAADQRATDKPTKRAKAGK